MAIEQPSDDQLKAIEAGKPVPLSGSKDGTTSADNDQPYVFGRKPHSLAPFPFTPRQFVKLLITRGEAHARAEADQDHPNLRRLYPTLAPDMALPKRRRGPIKPYGA